ncbi:MAG: hypothetical protein NWS63_02140 [Saprospiraceae bacterium]|nr:hypothetical protein [Saprospiraceae bacterium]
MTKLPDIFLIFYRLFLSNATKKRFERIIVSLAIISFLLHLGLIAAAELGWLSSGQQQGKFLSNPIGAIYTPFSFILVYEVYLLVYYLPKSISIYIGKQYEIITLIVIRRIFKDLANLDLSTNWFEAKYDLQFTYDIVATVVLFFLIFLFYKVNTTRIFPDYNPNIDSEREKDFFVQLKKILSGILVPVFLGLAIYSFGNWLFNNMISVGQMVGTVTDVNEVFFDDFFTILILTDVLLLLVSLFHTDQFRKVIRNSGFIISTILIKLSFGAEGLLNIALILSAVLFGLAIVWIHNKYEASNL